MNKPEAIQLADDRPSSCNDYLYQWAIDAEEMLRTMQSSIEALEKDAATMLDALKDALCSLEISRQSDYVTSKVRQAIDTAMQSEKVGV